MQKYIFRGDPSWLEEEPAWPPDGVDRKQTCRYGGEKLNTETAAERAHF